VHWGADGFLSDPKDLHAMIEVGKEYGLYRHLEGN